MKNHVTGNATVAAVAPTLHLGTYRRALLAIIVGNPLFTPAEQLRANHNAHECQDAARLARWTRNVRRVADEREAAASQPTAPAPTVAPTLADLANPAYVAAHGSRPYAHGLTVKQAAESLASMKQATAPAPTTAPETPQQWATPTQCDEIFRLACLRCFTAGERAATLRRLPQLTQAQAVREIGQLYATAWRRGTVPMLPENGAMLTSRPA